MRISFVRRSFVLALGVRCALSAVGPAAAGEPMMLAPDFDRFAPRVVNGTLTALYPSTGALLSPGNPVTAQLVCSGTLIGCDTFLTAAHCVCDTIGPDCQGANAPNPADYLVFLQHAGLFQVASISVRSDFDFPVGDVAVVKLATPVTGINPTPINLNRIPAVGSSATIVGFGRTGGAGADYGLKRAGDVAIASCTDGVSGVTSVCWQFTDPIGPPGDDSNTCNGDSGGPLFSDFGCGDTVAATTSGGTSASCLAPDHSYDANVFTYRSFIQTEGGADLANTSCGAMPQAGDSATTVFAASGALSSGTPQAVHSFAVSSGTAQLRVTMNAIDNGISDFDLYLKRGSPPTTTDFDCKDDNPSQFAACPNLSSPTPDTWYILVNRFSGSGLYQVTATMFPSGSPEPGTDGQVCNDLNACTATDVCAGGRCAGVAVGDGTPCDDGSGCTGPDICLAGACESAAAPLGTCQQPFAPGKASLQVKDQSSDQRDRLTWKWLRGTATSPQAFGDPTTTTAYELCVFDESAGTPAVVLDAHVTPSGTNWTPFSRGFKYKDRDGLQDGITAVMLRSGADGSASITVKGKGEGLATPLLPFVQDSRVRVQLLNGAACWEADYSSNTINRSDQFRAKAD